MAKSLSPARKSCCIRVYHVAKFVSYIFHKSGDKIINDCNVQGKVCTWVNFCCYKSYRSGDKTISSSSHDLVVVGSSLLQGKVNTCCSTIFLNLVYSDSFRIEHGSRWPLFLIRKCRKNYSSLSFYFGRYDP